MVRKSQQLAMKRYRQRTQQVLVRINPDTEPDIHRRINEVDNKCGYIKSLIQADCDRLSKETKKQTKKQ